MMRIKTNKQSGFSAIELLITLFIGVAFIATGYQLYSVIIKDGGDTRLRTRVSNIVYENLRLYSSQTTVPCSLVTPSPTPTLPSGLPNASISVSVTCPYGFASSTSKISVSVFYGTPQKEVTNAIYTIE